MPVGTWSFFSKARLKDVNSIRFARTLSHPSWTSFHAASGSLRFDNGNRFGWVTQKETFARAHFNHHFMLSPWGCDNKSPLPCFALRFFRAGPLLSFLIPPLSDVFLWRCSFRGVRQDKKDWRKVGSGLRVVLLRRLYSFPERYAFFPYSPCPLLPCLSYCFCSFLLICYMIYFNSCSLYAGIPLLLLYRTTMW